MGAGSMRAGALWVFSPDGGVAQLGEHLLCKQGVTGSIPVVSTKWSSAFVGEQYRGNQEFSAKSCLEQCVPGGRSTVAFLAWNAVCAVGASLFFCSVNMVLVRLWMRVAKAPLSEECLTGKAAIFRGPHPR